MSKVFESEHLVVLPTAVELYAPCADSPLLYTEQQSGAAPMPSSEQQSFANRLITGMVERFEVSPDDFSVLEAPASLGRSSQLTVAYTASNGLPKGNWNEITANEKTEDFELFIDGKFYDTRAGMNSAAYTAMQVAAYREGRTAPDSQALQTEQYEETHALSPWTWTWLTGERPISLAAPAGLCLHGIVERAYVPRRSDDEETIRFRPAVTFE